MALLVGLPVLVLRPQKFALCFTLASLLFMAAFAALRGPAAQLRTLCEPRRLPFTAAYVATMAATLWAACLRRSYVYTALCSGLQMVTLLYYLGTYVPGGPRGVRLFLRAVAKTAALLLRPLCYACSKCCQQLPCKPAPCVSVDPVAVATPEPAAETSRTIHKPEPAMN